MAVAFDEMKGQDGAIRPAYKELSAWLAEVRPDVLDYRRREAELLFRRIGITFAVYGEADSQERLIPFDVIPRILSASEWKLLSRGLEQRVKAINAYIKDIYGKRECLRAGIVPEDLVFQNPVFRPEMNGQKVPHDIYVHIAGIDIVRVDAETFYVLEDNARTPSGVSYMLENREIMLRLFPELFSRHRIAPVDNYPDELLATLQSVAPDSAAAEPSVVLLTPGVYNSAYYEHSFLADKLGIELVEGRDLFVKGEEVFMRTTQGPKRVDVIYRRLDDDFLDPLAFRPDSALGVPGIMSAYQAGNVTLANAVGTGVADDKAVYSYMPDIVKFFLGEEPILKNVPTFRCREEKHLSHVLDNIEELVVKEVHGSGGYGMLIGPAADKATIAAFKSKLKSQPANFIAQPTLALSTCPTCVESGVAPRHVDLRPFVLTGKDKVRIVPGGLDARRAQARLAGGQFQPGRRHQRHLGAGQLTCFRAPPTISTGSRVMWNAPNISRASWRRRSASRRLPLAYVGESNEWESAVATAGCANAFYAAFPEANEENVTDFLAFSYDNPSSIRSCFEAARTNARAVRTALTMEMWDAINGTWLELKRYGNGPTSREELSRFLRWVQESSLLFDGSAYRTMLRNDAYSFTRLGVFMERADNTARILDVKYHMLLPAHEHVGGPLDYFQWAAILRSVSALTSYHWVYRESLKPWLVADLLILKEEMPRSLASCYENIVTHLDKVASVYGRQGPSQRLARGIRTRLQNSRMEEIFQTGLHEFIQSFIADNNRIGATISQQYLA